MGGCFVWSGERISADRDLSASFAFKRCDLENSLSRRISRNHVAEVPPASQVHQPQRTVRPRSLSDTDDPSIQMQMDDLNLIGRNRQRERLRLSWLQAKGAGLGWRRRG